MDYINLEKDLYLETEGVGFFSSIDVGTRIILISIFLAGLLSLEYHFLPRMFSLKEILMENPTVSFLTQVIYVLISCLELLGVHITKASYV